MEFKDRKEKRKVNETMASLLVPMMNHLDEETQECVRLTIRMLNEQTVENEVKEGSDTVNREVWRKKRIGHWIEHPHERGENWEYSKYECSECAEMCDDDSCYCPCCGAEMVGTTNSDGNWITQWDIAHQKE